MDDSVGNDGAGRPVSKLGLGASLGLVVGSLATGTMGLVVDDRLAVILALGLFSGWSLSGAV